MFSIMWGLALACLFPRPRPHPDLDPNLNLNFNLNLNINLHLNPQLSCLKVKEGLGKSPVCHRVNTHIQTNKHPHWHLRIIWNKQIYLQSNMQTPPITALEQLCSFSPILVCLSVSLSVVRIYQNTCTHNTHTQKSILVLSERYMHF